MPDPAAELDSILEALPKRATARTRQWFRVRAMGSMPDVADVDIYDEIGSILDGVTAKDFISAISKLPETTKTINVHVSSLGGDVFEALAIANALRNHPATVVMLIEGVAASAATIVTQGGGDVVKISDNALVMVHAPTAAACGEAKDMRATAEALDRAHAAIVATYQRNSKLSADELNAMMATETWMDAEEALAAGFATEIVEGLRAAASFNPRALASLAVPEKHKAKVAALAPAAPGRRPVRIKNAAGVDIAAGDKGPSLEEFCEAVREALRAEIGDPWACCCGAYCGGACGWYVVETYQDGVVVSRNGDTWFYPITMTGDEITLGDAVEVDMVWIREPEAAADAPPSTDGVTAAGRKVINIGRLSATVKVAPISPAGIAAAGDVVGLCAAAGLDLAFAQKLIAENLTVAAVTKRVATEKTTRATAAARATGIQALCAKAGQQDLAAGYIAGEMTADQVRDHLTKITAKLDKAEIDSHLKPDHGVKPKPVLNVSAIYADRNRLIVASRN